jgi:hypothetical protein
MRDEVIIRPTPRANPAFLAVRARLLIAPFCVGLGFHSLPASAQTVAPPAAFYIGVGAGVQANDFGTQDLYAIGTANVSRGGAPLSSGSAAGPGSIGTHTETVVAPTVQAGFYQRIGEGDWLWGATLSYAYLGAAAKASNVLLPQAGAFTNADGSAAPSFNGNAFIRSYETRISHQIMLLPFVGYAFAPGQIYVGAGPTYSRVETTINGLIGFADIVGRPSDISGAPQDFSGSGWVWGAAAVVGARAFLDGGWFVDVRYGYAATQRQTTRYSSPFLNPNGVGGTVISGTLVGSSAGSVTTQGVTVTINRLF